MDQHFVTRFYLDGFCDPVTPEGYEPFLWESNLRDGVIKRRAPKNVATEANYYSVPDEKGDLDHWAEELLSLIESAAAPVVDKVRSGHFELTPEEREYLALFIGFLIIRVPSFRNYLEETAGRVAEAMLGLLARDPGRWKKILGRVPGVAEGLTPEKAEKLRELASDPTNFVARGTRGFSLGHAFKLAAPTVTMVANMRWQFLTAEGTEHFITGDTPVTWRNPKVRPPLGAGLGLRHTELSLPLGRQLCLVGTWTGGTGATPANHVQIQDFNRERTRHADRFIYADSEGAARAAQDVYRVLMEAGEAHAVPFRFYVLVGERTRPSS